MFKFKGRYGNVLPAANDYSASLIGNDSANVAGGNVAALRAGQRVLRDDKVIGLFPEGELTLDGKMQPLQPGAAAIACRSKAWIQPVYIAGNYPTWPKGAKRPKLGKVTVYFGKPFKPISYAKHRREAVNKTTQQIESAIHKLRDAHDKK